MIFIVNDGGGDLVGEIQNQICSNTELMLHVGDFIRLLNQNTTVGVNITSVSESEQENIDLWRGATMRHEKKNCAETVCEGRSDVEMLVIHVECWSVFGASRL